MEGGGAYNRSSRVQAAGLAPAIALFEEAAALVPLAHESHAISIADYGCSEGHNSMAPISAALRTLRPRVGSERAVMVFHTDLPENDFGGLFQTLSVDPDSYLRSDSAAFTSVIGRSFYEQLLPSNSVTLGWSSWSVQWLSRAPAAIPDQVQVAYSQDKAVRDAFARQAAEDWRTFLVHRASELRNGGRLVVLTMALDEVGNFGYQPLLEAIYGSLRQMVETGLIRAEELHRMVIPTVGRGAKDLAAPFDDLGRSAELAIEHLEVFSGEDRIWAEFNANGDANAFGTQWAAFSRASVFPTLASALDDPRQGSRVAGFIDRLQAEVASRLAKSPSEMLIPLAKMVVLKG
jgi:SAM dependent carboxyl methyltransferase